MVDFYIPPEHVTASEFTRWMEHLDKRFDRLDETQDAHEKRIAGLEVNQQAAGKLSAKLSAGISATVAGIIGGVFSWIGGR